MPFKSLLVSVHSSRVAIHVEEAGQHYLLTKYEYDSTLIIPEFVKVLIFNNLKNKLSFQKYTLTGCA